MGRHRFSFLLAIALAIAGLPVVAETPANIIASLKKYTPQEFDALRKLAKHDPQAQNVLGLAYLTQTRVQQDYEQAYQLFHKAALRGYAPAQNNLAFMYTHGLGMRVDLQQARQWVRQGAESGEVLAQVNLANLYFAGTGVKQDYQEAAKWFEIAARSGDARAQNNLGLM